MMIILAMNMVATTETTSTIKFQICEQEMAQHQIEFPEPVNCEVDADEKITSAKIELYLPISESPTFDAFLCQNKTTIICTTSYLLLYNHDGIPQQTYSPIENELCKRLSKNEEPQFKMFQLDEDIWSTDEDLGKHYSFIGESCTPTHNIILERGEATIRQGKVFTTWKTNLDINKEVEHVEKFGTILYEIPNEDYKHTHEKIEVDAEIADKFVIIEELQNTFIIKKNTSTGNRDDIVGIPNEAIELENEAFMRIIHEYNNTDHIKERQRRQQTTFPRKPQRAPPTIAPRKPQLINMQPTTERSPTITSTRPSTVETTTIPKLLTTVRTPAMNTMKPTKESITTTTTTPAMTITPKIRRIIKVAPSPILMSLPMTITTTTTSISSSQDNKIETMTTRRPPTTQKIFSTTETTTVIPALTTTRTKTIITKIMPTTTMPPMKVKKITPTKKSNIKMNTPKQAKPALKTEKPDNMNTSEVKMKVTTTERPKATQHNKLKIEENKASNEESNEAEDKIELEGSIEFEVTERHQFS